MLELSHNGVVILDAVVAWHQSSNLNLPFAEWWGGMSQEEKNQILLQILITNYGEVFHQSAEIGVNNG
jgi:hypothetical protein